MPLSPNNTSVVPPHGWSVELEGLGPPIKSDNFSDFIRQVRVRLESNGKDEHGWREDVLDLMCHQRPDIPCEDVDAPTRAITGADMRRWVRTMYEAWKAGAVAVEPAEQDRRAAICRVCPKRGYVSCFGGCGALAQALSEIVVGTKAQNYPDLNKTACLACSCEISTLVLFPIEVLRAVDEKTGFQPENYDPKCWKVEPQPNIESTSPLDSSPQPPPDGT